MRIRQLVLLSPYPSVVTVAALVGFELGDVDDEQSNAWEDVD